MSLRFISWSTWEELTGKANAEDGDCLVINGTEYIVAQCDAKGVYLAEVIDDEDDEDDYEDSASDDDDTNDDE